MHGLKTANTDEAGKGMKPLAVPSEDSLPAGRHWQYQHVGVDWQAGKVRTVSVGRRRLVIYASLEALLSNGG